MIHDFEVRHALVTLEEIAIVLGIEDGALRIGSREGANGVHGVPDGQHQELGAISDRCGEA